MYQDAYLCLLQVDMSCKFSSWHAIQEIESLLYSSLVVKSMNSLLDSFHSIRLPVVIFPKGLNLRVFISIPSKTTCIVIVDNSWLSFATFTDFLLNCYFSFFAVLTATSGKNVVNKIKQYHVCFIKHRTAVLFLLFYIRQKHNYNCLETSISYSQSHSVSTLDNTVMSYFINFLLKSVVNRLRACITILNIPFNWRLVIFSKAMLCWSAPWVTLFYLYFS